MLEYARKSLCVGQLVWMLAAACKIEQTAAPDAGPLEAGKAASPHISQNSCCERG